MRAYWIALLLGLALRLGYAWHAQTHGYIPTNVDGYETLALSLLERGEYAMVAGVPTSMCEPTYPFLIAAVYGLLGGRQPWAVLLLQGVMSVSTAALILKLGLKLFGEGAARAAFWTTLLYPPAIYYSAYFYRETLSAFLFTALIYASQFWSAPPRAPRTAAWAVFSGFVAMAFALTNSAAAPAAILAGIALGLAAPVGARWRRLALFFVPLLVGLLLWTGRNYAAQGLLVLGSTHGGEEFYQALIVPPEDLGLARHAEILGSDPAWQEAARLPEARRNARLMEAGFAFIRDNPWVYLSRAVNGCLKFWRLWPYQRQYKHSYALLMIVSLVSDGWIVPLGFCGLWLFRSRWRECPALPAGILGLTLVFGCVHAVIRYRTPLMGGMILLAVAAAAKIRRLSRA